MKDYHWWWDVPEFIAAQEDPQFKAWVEATELGMELEVDSPVDWFPGLPEDDRFSDEAIQFVETTLLDRYEDRATLDSHWEDKWRFIKYLGQAFVDKLECKWVWQPRIDPYWTIDGPAIECPWPSTTLFDLIPMINAAVRRRTGEEWIFVFRNNREDYLRWKASGSPRG